LSALLQKHDLMQENQWLSKFDVDGAAGVSLDEFKAGSRGIGKLGLVDKLIATSMLTAIKSYAAHSSFAL